MFGPDLCANVNKGHFIVNYKGNNYSITNPLSVESDMLTHQYTLILRPDNTFTYLIDNVEDLTSSIKESFKLPEFDEDGSNLQLDLGKIGGVGIEIHLTTAGTIFDNIFIGDNIEEARAFSEETFTYKKKNEPPVKRKFDREQEKQQEEALRDYEKRMSL